MLAPLAPVLFVLIWSTGFVAARLAVPHADPQLFLVLRMGATAALLAAAGSARRDPWPRGKRLLGHIAAGAIMPGFYLCASWWAVQHGMPAGIMALLGALQPLPIAALSFLLLGERLSRGAIAGMALGALGVTLVLLPVLDRAGAVAVLPAAFGVGGVVAMAAGTLALHARLSGDALAPAVALQNIGGTASGIVAFSAVGELRWDESALLWATMAWSVLALSIGGLGLFAWLIARQGATRVSVLLLLVPALAAIEARILFGERLGPVQLVGFALALAGVLLARRTPRGT